MAKCDNFTEIPLTEKPQTDEEDVPQTLRDRCCGLIHWVRYWWTWWHAMCC